MVLFQSLRTVVRQLPETDMLWMKKSHRSKKGRKEGEEDNEMEAVSDQKKIFYFSACY